MVQRAGAFAVVAGLAGVVVGPGRVGVDDAELALGQGGDLGVDLGFPDLAQGFGGLHRAIGDLEGETTVVVPDALALLDRGAPDADLGAEPGAGAALLLSAVVAPCLGIMDAGTRSKPPLLVTLLLLDGRR